MVLRGIRDTLAREDMGLHGDLLTERRMILDWARSAINAVRDLTAEGTGEED